MRDVLGDDHPFSLSCQINKANCLHDLGLSAEAESLQRDALERLNRTLGASHPDTQVCEANLAIVLRAQGRTEEGEALQLRVITGLGEALGNDHPSVTALREWRLQAPTSKFNRRNRGDRAGRSDLRGDAATSQVVPARGSGGRLLISGSTGRRVHSSEDNSKNAQGQRRGKVSELQTKESYRTDRCFARPRHAMAVDPRGECRDRLRRHRGSPSDASSDFLPM